MPKNRVRDRKTKNVSRIREKFRIGNREVGKSALLMSTEELVKQFPRMRGRDQQKTRIVLTARQVDVNAELAKAEAA